MRAVTFAGLLLLATGAAAQDEAWECQSASVRSENDAVLLSLTINNDRASGEIFVVGTVYDAQFEIKGFDRWWYFGPVDAGEPAYAFRMEPDGTGYYYESLDRSASGSLSPRESYICGQRQQRGEVAARDGEEAQRLSQEAAIARQRADTDPELQRLLAAEDERRRANEAGQLDEYIRSVENRIYENWIQPVSAQAGLECVVNITLAPSGNVVAVLISHCNVDEALAGSIEAAVLRSSPMPPPISSLYAGNLEFFFSPDE